MLAISTNFILELRKASFHGFLVIWPLAPISAKIGVSCLCPLTVQTRIPEADRNRPDELAPENDPRTPEELEAIRTRFRNFLNEGVAPEVIAGQLIEGIREGRFYLLNDTWADDVIRSRIDYVLNRENPDPAVAFGSAWRR